MNSNHQNLSVGVRPRAVWIVAAALSSVLAIAGALARPVLCLDLAEAREEHARQDAQACRAEREILRRYDEAHGEERTAEALRALSARLPPNISPIEVNGVLRMLADVHRIELGSATIAGAKPTSFAVLDDSVCVREVDLRGSGALPDWVEFTEDLERCGYPTSVLELSLDRQSAEDPAFEVHLVLGLYSSGPAAPNRTGGT